MTAMKISDIDNNVKFIDFENFFDVFEDASVDGNPYAFNLNQTIYLNSIPKKKFKVDHDSFWTTLSYMLYGTTRLWWILMKVNNVQVDDTFQPVKAGTTIECLEKETIRSIVSRIGGLS